MRQHRRWWSRVVAGGRIVPRSGGSKGARGTEKLPAVPLLANRGFDAVGLMQRVKEKGCAAAIRVKETWRVRVRHPLRQESQQG